MTCTSWWKVNGFGTFESISRKCLGCKLHFLCYIETNKRAKKHDN